MSHDGKCPDMYECRLTNGDYKTFGDWQLRAEVVRLKAELNQAVYMQDKVRAERDKAEAENAKLRKVAEAARDAVFHWSPGQPARLGLVSDALTELDGG